jgi:DNA-binding CsgD family transcriptional regulator
MRRVVIEMSLGDMRKFDASSEPNPMWEKVESMEIMQFLHEGPDEIAIVCRVKFRDPSLGLEDFRDPDITEMQVLDHDKEGAYTYFIKSRPNPARITAGGYLSVPFEIRDGRARMTYLGTGKQVKAFLDDVESTGAEYRVESITDAKFPKDSPLSRLTEKQRRVLTTAYELGYYDLPRRISSQQLGERLKIGSSTLVGHRRRAERRLLAELLGTGR